jgi:hypothetical protein
MARGISIIKMNSISVEKFGFWSNANAFLPANPFAFPFYQFLVEKIKMFCFDFQNGAASKYPPKGATGHSVGSLPPESHLP